MDFFTHFIIAVLFGNLFLKELSFEYIVFIGFIAIFPDLDIFIEPLKKVWHTYYILHRGASHSYITGILITGIAGGLFSLFTGKDFLEAWFIGYIAFSLHVSLDFFTTSKVPAFFPFSKKEYRLIAERAINFVVMFPSITIFVFFGFRLFNLPLGFLFTKFTNYYLIVYLLYFSYRLLLKIGVQSSLPKNSHYLPGILPFFYTIYKNYEIEGRQVYVLSKKFIFSSKNKKIFDIHIPNDSEHMKYLKKSLKLSKKYRFFSKWEAMIPFVTINNNQVKVTLILAESLSRNRCYQLNVIMDNNSGDILSEIDGFFQISEESHVQDV